MRFALPPICLAFLILLAACETSPPAADASNALSARVPALFNDDHSSYVVLVKNDERTIAAEHRLTFDGIGPMLILGQEVIVWKVAPGVHHIGFGPRQGDKALRLEVFDGSRVVFEVDGGGGLYIRSFASDRAGLAQNTHFAGYHDMSADAPPEPLRSRR